MIKNSVNPEKAIEEVNEKKIEANEVKRHDNYGCLCPWLTLKLKNTCFLKTCMETICGVPNYVWFITISAMLAAVGVTIWLTYSVITFKATNNSYNAICTSHLDCNSTLGLQCATLDRLCDCPIYFAKGRCDCSSGFYWSGTRCSMLIQKEGQACANDYNCDQNKDLKCINKSCGCVPPKQWNSTLNACDYVFERCGFESSSFSYTYRALLSQRQDYFVDVCIDLCYKTRYSFALVASSGGTSNCLCRNSNNADSNITCTAFCYGVNGRPYACGQLNQDTRYRAYYKIIY